jgi:hypothetical protein
MNANGLNLGDAVADAPRCAGTITRITPAGYPQLTEIAVAWLYRTDGFLFDPYNQHLAFQTESEK